MDITDQFGKFRTEFTAAELATLEPERVPLFNALRVSHVESRAAEEALREATANKIACGNALSAAERDQLKFRPKITPEMAARQYIEASRRR